MKSPVSTKRISQNFDFGDMRSGQFSDQIIRYRAMRKYSNAFYSEHTREIMVIISRLSYLRPLSMTHMYVWPNYLSGSFEVIRGQMRFLPLTFDRIEVEQCGWSQCVSHAETHRLVCNMTYLGHDVTSSDLDLRSNFDLDFFQGQNAYISTRLDEWNTVESELFRYLS